jgi:hypothetical protein
MRSSEDVGDAVGGGSGESSRTRMIPHYSRLAPDDTESNLPPTSHSLSGLGHEIDIAPDTWCERRCVSCAPSA